MSSHELVNGKATSCGCGRVKHGHARRGGDGRHRYSLTYKVWQGIVSRCTVPSDGRFPQYGAAGIGICDRWRENFATFLADVGERPSRRHSLDRIDNTKGYEPGNVRWATRAEQARNRKSNRFVEFRGERLCITDLAQRFGLSSATLAGRLNRGWPIERAVAEAPL